MAAPVVSGAVILMVQKTPTLTPDMVQARLMKTAVKNFPVSSIATDPVTGETFTSNYDLFTVGAGYLDVWAALNNNDSVSASGAALSPTAVFNPSKGKGSLAFGSSVVWGTSITWGTSVVWGTNVVWGTGNHGDACIEFAMGVERSLGRRAGLW